VARGDYVIGVEFIKSKWNTRESVKFDVDVSVLHPTFLDLFCRTNAEAEALHNETELAEIDNCATRLSRRDPADPAHWPWSVTLRSEPAETAADVIRFLRGFFLPVVGQEVQRPLPTPTPTQARPDGPTPQQEVSSLEWLRTEIPPR
jgi:hypothetical protein